MLLDKPCGNICCKAYDVTKACNCSIVGHTAIIGECEDYFEEIGDIYDYERKKIKEKA